MIRILIPGPLRGYAGHAKSVEVDARDVRDPGLLQRISDSYDRRLGR